MWTCSCCGTRQDASEMRCAHCGFDESCNYSRYPTLISEVPNDLEPAVSGSADLTAEEMLALAACYKDGRKLPHDPAAAVKWYRMAAGKGSAEGRYWLGVCYQLGIGTAKRLSRAVGLYRMAAEQTYVPAMAKLGSCYESGTGVRKDSAQALYWYRRAADLGDPKAGYKVKVLEAQQAKPLPKDSEKQSFKGFFYAPQMMETPTHEKSGWSPAPSDLD